MGIPLRPRQARVFDEVVDIVNFDLVLVMDRFDHTEVLREVAVLDTINPGGAYSSRVHRLGRYLSAQRRFSPHLVRGWLCCNVDVLLAPPGTHSLECAIYHAEGGLRACFTQNHASWLPDGCHIGWSHWQLHRVLQPWTPAIQLR